MREIYFDNSATTKICREALDKYIEVSEGLYGNPSSLHSLGFGAQKVVDAARAEILKSLGAKDSEVIFTSSGSEANNLAILGRAFAKERYRGRARIIVTDSEHSSVSEPANALLKLGFKVDKIPTRGGKLNTDALKSAITPDTVLVSMMMVNNESGALYDVAEAARIAKSLSGEVMIHIDATQSYLKIPFTKTSLMADMITLSSHKIEGPKGVGALVLDRTVLTKKGLSPLIFGGGQEKGLRSGTENVPGIAAFGEAVRQKFPKTREFYAHTSMLRERLINGIASDDILSQISPTLPEKHAPHILNITLPRIKSETMLHYLSSFGIYVSSGSACSSNSLHSSSALISYGRSADEADYSIRISFCRQNTPEEVDIFLETLKEGLKKLTRVR